jgi:hypothetical protein
MEAYVMRSLHCIVGPRCTHTRRHGWALAGFVALAVAGVSPALADENKQAHICNMATIKSERNLVAVPGVDGKLPAITEVPFNSAALLDKSITKKVYVRTATVKRTLTGTVLVRTMVANCTDHDLRIEGRTQFYDADQTPAEAPSAWKRIFLEPRSDSLYQESSISTDAVHFYFIEVREAR